AVIVGHGDHVEAHRLHVGQDRRIARRRAIRETRATTADRGGVSGERRYGERESLEIRERGVGAANDLHDRRHERIGRDRAAGTEHVAAHGDGEAVGHGAHRGGRRVHDRRRAWAGTSCATALPDRGGWDYGSHY